MPLTDHTLTDLLNAASCGDHEAVGRSADMVLTELRKLASHWMAQERRGHAISTTELVHEAYLRLFGHAPIHFKSRKHFFVIASEQMRRVLVDFARARHAQKRGAGAFHLPVTDPTDRVSVCLDVLDVDRALAELGALAPRPAKVVEMRFFAGYGFDEIGKYLAISPKTTQREWRFARAWLFDRLRALQVP